VEAETDCICLHTGVQVPVPGSRNGSRFVVAIALLGLAACAGGPLRREAATPAAQPTAPAAVPVQPEPVPVVIHAPAPFVEPGAQYEDLLARMRAGFALGGFENPAIDREADWYANHPDYIERIFGRAGPWLHFIVSEVEARNLPLELAVLPIIESAFEPYAYSRAAAAGLWQFIPGTGTRFGLKQNWWYDGRRDAVSATRAALDYLQWLNGEFGGDWLLAVAAYNCGENCVARAIAANRAAGKPTDFWNLRLPAETRAYVPKLLAMSQIVASPGEFGLSISELPNVPYFVQVGTGGQINLEVAAELAGITIEDIYALNPAFHRFATDPSGPHFLLLPVDSAETFEQNLLLLTPDQRMRVERYQVRGGDTVTSVAKRFNSTTQMIRELNGLGSVGAIEIGSELRVPSSVSTLPPKVARAAAMVDSRGSASARRRAGGGIHVVRSGDSLWNIARRTGVDVKTLARMNGLSADAQLRPGQKLNVRGSGTPAAGGAARAPATDPEGSRRVTYVVRSGDTLSSIARVLQVSVASLRSWNDLGRRNVIRPGQKLVAFVRGGT
jgi:membrane-bound lytic murein transglycosylase D